MKAKIEQVMNILRDDVEARDSDGVLFWRYLKSNGVLIPGTAENIGLLNGLKTVARFRRKVQNDWKRYVASEGVRGRRAAFQVFYRERMVKT